MKRKFNRCHPNPNHRVVVTNSTYINITLEIQFLAWESHKNVAGLTTLKKKEWCIQDKHSIGIWRIEWCIQDKHSIGIWRIE